MSHSDSFFIFLDKPIGLTSQQCLTKFKKKFHYKKVGHHGTLDPFANGLLLVGVNEATKFFQFIDDSQKTYEATIRFGVKTDTLDHTGRIVMEKEVPEMQIEELKHGAKTLVGKISQFPPMYSAVKVQGKRLHELARKGQEVIRKSRQVEIFDLQIIQWKKPELKIRATVSRGTYIRVLAEQLAEKFQTFGHLTQLKRTNLCGFDFSKSFDIDSDQIPKEKMISVSELLAPLTRAELSEKDMQDIFHGKRIKIAHDKSGNEDSKFQAFHKARFLGIVQKHGEILKPLRLINPSHFL